MFDDDTLGDDEKPSGMKASYFLIIFIVLGALFFGSVGASGDTKNVIYFYIIFGSVLGVGPILFDAATKGRDNYEYIDTVTVEEPTSPWLGLRVQIIVAVLIAVYIVFRISTTGSAIVGSPSFAVFDSKVGNALLSGAVGIVENWVFFGFVGPTIFSFFTSKFNSRMFGALMMIALTTGLFLGYHTFRYGTNEAALLSVAFFGFLNCIATIVFRSLIVSDFFHFFNNVGSTIFGAQRIALQFA